MALRTQRSIYHSCIGGITVMTFWTGVAEALSTLVLECSIFTPDWLWCAYFAEMTWCTRIICWCRCALATGAVKPCSTLLCGS